MFSSVPSNHRLNSLVSVAWYRIMTFFLYSSHVSGNVPSQSPHVFRPRMKAVKDSAIGMEGLYWYTENEVKKESTGDVAEGGVDCGGRHVCVALLSLLLRTCPQRVQFETLVSVWNLWLACVSRSSGEFVAEDLEIGWLNDGRCFSPNATAGSFSKACSLVSALKWQYLWQGPKLPGSSCSGSFQRHFRIPVIDSVTLPYELPWLLRLVSWCD